MIITSSYPDIYALELEIRMKEGKIMQFIAVTRILETGYINYMNGKVLWLYATLFGLFSMLFVQYREYEVGYHRVRDMAET